MSNGAGDIATQIKAMFNRRIDLIKEKKKKKYFIAIAIVGVLVAGYYAIHSHFMKDEYEMMLANLDQEK